MLNLFVRNLSTIAIGILLLMFREQAMPFIVMCVGSLFLFPALFILALMFVPLFKRYNSIDSGKGFVALMSLGSMLLGLWMLVNPDFFVAILMWVLGASLLVIGLSQIIGLWRANSKTKVPGVLYILPVAILVAGLIILVYPFEVASLPFTILGVAAIVSAVSDVFGSLFVLYMTKKVSAKENEDIIDVDN